MTGLRISPDLELPLDAVTETIGILAVKRAGKSNAAVVLAEEMFARGIPWVADPKGDWWGVRAAGAGGEPGLAVRDLDLALLPGRHEPPAAAKEGGAVQPGPSAARSSPTPGNRTVPGTAITEEKEPAAPAGDAPRGPAGLGKAERAILTAVVQKPGSSPTVIAFLAQYSPRSSSFQNALGSLRGRDLLARGTPLRPLDGAVAALGGVEPLPGGEELRRFWLNRLGRAERAILEVLLDRYPQSISKEELAEASGYSMTSSSFQNALGKLRGLGLCVRGNQRATDELMEALDG